MGIFDVIVLSIVEGITEFLPISSTAHLVFASRLLGIAQTDFLTSFEIFVQLGAVLAIAGASLRKLIADFGLLKLLIVSFIPTALIGVVVYPFVKALLVGSPLLPIITLGVGGVALIVFERWYTTHGHVGRSLKRMNNTQALVIGLTQTIAFIPGVSRAAATIVGGMAMRLDRRAAVEFSFLLAIPTMFAATGLDLVQTSFVFSLGEWGLLLLGFILSGIVAFLTVRWLLRYVESHTFASFGAYRIIASLVLLGIFFLG